MALPVTELWSQSSGSTQQITAYGAYALLEGTMQIVSGSAGVEVTGGTYNTARRTDETPAAAQYSQVLLTAGQISTGIYCGPAVRCQSGANSSYHVETNGSNFYLSKCLAGVQTTLVGPVTLSSSGAAGDAFRLEIEEITGTTTLRVYLKGVLQGTYTDTSSPITAAGFLGVFGYGNTPGTRVIGTWTAGNLYASGPSITSVSSASPASGSSLTITGTGFGATQGAGGVTIGGVAQTVTAWSDTSITVTVSRGTNKYGVALNVVVTDNTAASSSPFALSSLQPQSGWAYVNVGTPNADATLRLQVVSGTEPASGDQIAHDTVGGTVTVFPDLTHVVYGDTLTFLAELWTATDGWGSTGLQTLSTPQRLQPASTVLAGSWLSALGGTLHNALNETSPDDASYVYTETPEDALEVAVSVAVDPAAGYGHVAGYRIAGNGLSNLRVELKQGSTVIATFLHAPVPTEWQSFFQVLTPAQADSITDYTALRLRFTEY